MRPTKNHEAIRGAKTFLKSMSLCLRTHTEMCRGVGQLRIYDNERHGGPSCPRTIPTRQEAPQVCSALGPGRCSPWLTTNNEQNKSSGGTTYSSFELQVFTHSHIFSWSSRDRQPTAFRWCHLRQKPFALAVFQPTFAVGIIIQILKVRKSAAEIQSKWFHNCWLISGFTVITSGIVSRIPARWKRVGPTSL